MRCSIALCLGIAGCLVSACSSSNDETSAPAATESGGDVDLRLEKASVSPPSSQVSVSFFVSDQNGNPVAGLQAGDFAIFENDEINSVFESSKRISPDEREFVMYTLLLLDLSDSIRRSGALEPLLDAAETLVRRIFETNEGNVHRMTVYWFDGSASIHPALEDGKFSSDQSEIISTIRSLPASNDRSTNLFGAVVESLNVIRKTLNDTDDGIIRRGNFVLFTDGSDNAGRVSRQIAVQRINQEVGDGKQLDKDIRAFTIGLGGEIDIPVLQEIGRTQNVFPQNVSELFPAFDAIASRIQDLAASFYLLEYCSPKRAGQHDLKVEVALGDEVGFLTTRFDARGFTAECAIDFIDSEVDGFSGSGNSRGLEVRLGSGGDRYVVGDFDGSFAVGGIEMSSQRRRGFVARLGPDENGSPVRAAWSFGGGDATMEPESLAVLPGDAGDQSVVVAGHFSGELQLDGVTYDARGKRHGFLARFDPAGELAWFRHFGGESTQLREVEYSRFQAVDEEGVPIGPTERAVVVVGEYEKFIDIDGTPAFETNGGSRRVRRQVRPRRRAPLEDASHERRRRRREHRRGVLLGRGLRRRLHRRPRRRSREPGRRQRYVSIGLRLQVACGRWSSPLDRRLRLTGRPDRRGSVASRGSRDRPVRRRCRRRAIHRNGRLRRRRPRTRRRIDERPPRQADRPRAPRVVPGGRWPGRRSPASRRHRFERRHLGARDLHSHDQPPGATIHRAGRERKTSSCCA